MERIIDIDEELYEKVMNNKPLTNPGDLTKVDLEIAKFGWGLVDELVTKGKIDANPISDPDNVNLLYFINLIKYANVRTFINVKNNIITNVRFCETKDITPII